MQWSTISSRVLSSTLDTFCSHFRSRPCSRSFSCSRFSSSSHSRSYCSFSCRDNSAHFRFCIAPSSLLLVYSIGYRDFPSSITYQTPLNVSPPCIVIVSLGAWHSWIEQGLRHLPNTNGTTVSWEPGARNIIFPYIKSLPQANQQNQFTLHQFFLFTSTTLTLLTPCPLPPPRLLLDCPQFIQRPPPYLLSAMPFQPPFPAMMPS